MIFWIVFYLFFPILRIEAQTYDFQVMSYNVENLFDCVHEEGKKDLEYIPSGSRHWTAGRYYRKLQQIAKVILASGKWSTPALIGLCEIENDSTLIHLLKKTPLSTQHYQYVITHSPDERGIDVALLYQPDKFALIGYTCYRIPFIRHPQKHSRDLLHVWGKVITGDTLDLFVCHQPSRYGGELASLPDRQEAACFLREKTDSLFLIRSAPSILIMGDFNDTPTDPSLIDALKAHPVSTYTPVHSAKKLYNLFYGCPPLPFPGSHKYQGEWNLLDQFIVSGTLLDTTKSIHIIPNSATLFAPSFLLTKDKTHRGVRPKRTYYGFKYEGGYSDHLPIIVNFSLSLPIH